MNNASELIFLSPKNLRQLRKSRTSKKCSPQYDVELQRNSRTSQFLFWHSVSKMIHCKLSHCLITILMSTKAISSAKSHSLSTYNKITSDHKWFTTAKIDARLVEPPDADGEHQQDKEAWSLTSERYFNRGMDTSIFQVLIAMLHSISYSLAWIHHNLQRTYTQTL